MKGLNARLDSLQAAVLRVKLKYLHGWNAQRARHAATYNTLLHHSPGIVLPLEKPDRECVYHLYVIRISRRDEVRSFLELRQIQTGIHYPVLIHLQKAYADLGYREGDYPVTEQVAREILSLPMYPELMDEQLNRVAHEIRGCFQGQGSLP